MQTTKSTVSKRTWLLLAVVLLIAAWMRVPRISEGLPFFYQEDEAHHFNRVVEMVQQGTYNPRYFHKPSLHFYLRMPVVAASFLWNVREGHIRSVKEIQTRDKFGLAGYAFSVSHPGIVKWNRGFSVDLSILTVLLTFLLGIRLTKEPQAALLASLLVAISPFAVSQSAMIGVDVVVALFSLLGVYLAQRVYEKFSVMGLAWVGLVCGLAVSSKYNALPIAVVPLVICLVTRQITVGSIATAIFSPIVGFFLGTPFSLLSLPLFLDQFAYEIWHYGIAGHEGHSADPGLSQALFYFSWLRGEALGSVAATLGVIAIPYFLTKDFRRHLVWLTFPVLFAALMIMQRANFTRNMLVLIPFFALSAALIFFHAIHAAKINQKKKTLLTALLSLLLVMPPLLLSLQERSEATQVRDSRVAAMDWLTQLANEQKESPETAIDGELQFPPTLFHSTGVSRINTESVNLQKLYLDGFERLILPSESLLLLKESSYFSNEKIFAGESGPQRIINNPSIAVLKANPFEQVKETLTESTKELANHSLQFNVKDPSLPACFYGSEMVPGSPSENFCWIKSLVSPIEIVPNNKTVRTKDNATYLTISVMTPWLNQTLSFLSGESLYSYKLTPGEWQQIELPIRKNNSTDTINLLAHISKLSSPSSHGLSTDTRRLGVAIRIN